MGAESQRNQAGMESRPVEVGGSLSSMRKIVSSETNWLKEQEDLCEGWLHVLWVSGDTGVVGVERISCNAVDMCRVTLDTGKLADYTP